ncbi:MAG: A/G-specific adenine glycosylase [Niabella sp.]
MHKLLSTNTFRRLLLGWDENMNQRRMPWKGEKDPYRIWLSEVILQQTRVEQGLGYYERFIERYPTIVDLAHAPEQEVFKLWEGLGYYSRCRNLLATAKQVAFEMGGHFPDDFSAILKLKGVGPYTAAAIASFAYNLPYAVIDGNVFRVLSRVYGIGTPIDSIEGKKQFVLLADELLDRKQPGRYNQALMDFGATVCKPAAPLCASCIFKSKCVAFQTDNIAAYPVKKAKPQVAKRYFHFFLIEHKNQLPTRERTGKDIWRHLHEFPLIELDKEDADGAIAHALENGWISADDEIVSVSAAMSQTLTHQKITARFIHIKTKRKPKAFSGFHWVSRQELSFFPFPKLINQYLQGQ